jgi:S-formylglutathione hydrolase FrmB
MRKANLIIATAMAACIALLAFSFKARTSAEQQSAPAKPPAATDGSRIDYATMQSAALGRELKFAVQLPPSYDKDPKRKFPVLYFLHGMNGNEGEFENRGVAAAINKLREDGKIGEMIIVAPGGKNSFYLNAKNGEQYEDAIIKDLIPHVEKTYRTAGTRDGRAIQGISMGGYGALVLAFKHPEMFSSVTAHCAAIFTELPNTSGTDRRGQFLARLVGSIFGEPADQAFFHANNPMDLAVTNAALLKKSAMKIYFDVGDQDRYGFTQPNKDFAERLTKAGVAHEFHVFPGGHGWEYMISVAQHSYGFLWGNFKPNGKPAGKSAAK